MPPFFRLDTEPKMIKRIATTALLLTSIQAQAVELLATIKPLEMIAQEIIVDGDTTSTLLNSNASPHDYALKPSDLIRLQQSDLVVWFGQDLESFLVKPIANIDHALTLQEQDSIELRKFGKKCGCGHHHSTYDPHVWLGPRQAVQVARVIAERLVELNPEKTNAYQHNLEKFQYNMMVTASAINYDLKPVKNDGYYVFHDAYGYFEEHFHTNNLGHFTVEPDRKPGAKKLIKIRTTIIDKNVQCVFTEPQFTPAVIESTVRGTNAKIGSLDPLGTDIKVEKGSYFTFLKSISNSLTSCLK